MSSTVGTKGQIVISKDIREQLGIQPGWMALQRVVDDHVEIYFVPPEHNLSLKGSLAKHTSIRVPTGEDWSEAREIAWADSAEE